MIIKLDIDEINFAYLWFESVYNDKFALYRGRCTKLAHLKQILS